MAIRHPGLQVAVSRIRHDEGEHGVRCCCLQAARCCCCRPPRYTRPEYGQARSLALVVLLVGALTIGEHVLAGSSASTNGCSGTGTARMSGLLPRPHGLVERGRVLLLGLALLRFDWEPRASLRPAELLALLVIVLSSLAAIEYLSGQAIAYPIFRNTRMALHTFAAFAVLGAGVIVARPAMGVYGAIRSRIVSALERRVYVAATVGLAALLVAGSASFFGELESMDRAAQLKKATKCEVSSPSCCSRIRTWIMRNTPT